MTLEDTESHLLVHILIRVHPQHVCDSTTHLTHHKQHLQCCGHVLMTITGPNLALLVTQINVSKIWARKFYVLVAQLILTDLGNCATFCLQHCVDTLSVDSAYLERVVTWWLSQR